MKHYSSYGTGWQLLAVCAFALFTVNARAQSDFNSSMARFEGAKKISDYAECEKWLKQALSFQVTDYAAGSLVWAQINQNHTQDALKSAKWMVNAVGSTPYAVASLLDSALREGEISTARTAASSARQLNLDRGDHWTNAYLREVLQRFDGLRKPAIYELHWTIPGSEFTQNRPSRLFAFPILESPVQHFTFTLSGEIGHRIVRSTPEIAEVEITGTPGTAVEVSGRAEITRQYLSARDIRMLHNIPLTPAPASETGVMYYGSEPFDPSTESIQPVVRTVKRVSAVDTIQAILT